MMLLESSPELLLLAQYERQGLRLVVVVLERNVIEHIVDQHGLGDRDRGHIGALNTHEMHVQMIECR